jgi:hypothetical protein
LANNNPAGQNQGQQSPQASNSPQQASATGGSSFNINLIKPSSENRGASIFWGFTIVMALLWLLRRYYGSLNFDYILFGSFVIFIIAGIVTSNKQKDYANLWIAGALLIWLIDMSGPELPLLGGLLGPPFSGFKFLWTDFFEINWGMLVSSGIVFSLLYVNMVFDIVKKSWLQLWMGFGLIILFNNVISKYFGVSSFRIETFLPSIKFISIIAVLVFVIAGIFIFRKSSYRRSEEISDFLSYVVMIVVFSFFWINRGWQGNTRALFHAGFILFFGFMYIAKKEKDRPMVWHLLIPLLLIFDFFGYGLLLNSGILSLKFIPPLAIFIIFYTYEQDHTKYAVWTVVFIMTIFIVLSVDASGFDTQGGFAFRPNTEEQFTLSDFAESISNRIRGFTEDRLDIATAGLYRGTVEQNQYESLGVYFGNIRAADPRFYDDEPVTLWGTLRSKSYQDAVIVDYKCYRWDGTRKIDSDNTIPNQKFPMFKLDEIDTQCTFFPDPQNKLKAGPNTVTFSAEYNFGTDAYLKTYFIDRNTYRANVREDIDSLGQYGIKDRNPVSIFTNGPVEIGINAGPLVTVSEGFAINPTIGITLTNRKEIQDEDSKIITKWDGVIKNITELVLLVPPGIILPNIDDCKEPRGSPESINCPCTMPFMEYDETLCINNCEEQIKAPCDDACNFVYLDQSGKSGCLTECENSFTQCKNECDFLFSTAGEDFQGRYTGYALDVDSIEFKDLNKDIDKHRSFKCRFNPTNAVLEDIPISTRYFRVRARYNYLIENSASVQIEKSPVQSRIDGDVFRTALDNYPISQLGNFEDVDSIDLVMAIAYVESGIRHCCLQAGRTTGRTCDESGDLDCPPNRIIASESSKGMMQIQYNRQDVIEEVNERERRLCSGKTIFNRDCNLLVGLDILNEKLRIFGNGCEAAIQNNDWTASTHPTVTNACNNGRTSDGATTFKSYRGLDAALRGYNGWGYANGRSDHDYVNRVRSALGKIQNGIIVDEDGIREFFASRTGPGMGENVLIEEGTPTSSATPPTSPLVSTTPQFSGSYDEARNEVTITWSGFNENELSYYEVFRKRVSSSTPELICRIDRLSQNQYNCIDDKDLIQYWTYIYQLRGVMNPLINNDAVELGIVHVSVLG